MIASYPPYSRCSLLSVLTRAAPMDMFVSAIKQHPGQQQVTRRVIIKVKVPGKHFPALQAAEQAQSYWGEAVEHKERHGFPRHIKAWGAAHTGPAIRFICASDAIDDPDTAKCMVSASVVPWGK